MVYLYLNEHARVILQSIIGIWIQSTWLLIIGLIVGRYARRRNALSTSAVYRATMVSVIASASISIIFTGRIHPLITIGLPTNSTVVTKASPAVYASIKPSNSLETARIKVTLKSKVTNLNRVANTYHEPQHFKSPLNFRLLYIIVDSLWLIGFLIGIVRIALCMAWVMLKKRRADVCVNGANFDILNDLSRQFNIRCPKLLVTNDIRGLFVAGIFTPTIFMPGNFSNSLNNSEKRAILSHELAHIRHHDCLWNFLFRFFGAIFWIQPFFRLLRIRWQEVSEEVCDEWVLALDCAPVDYATVCYDWLKIFN